MMEGTCLSYINLIDILYKHIENTTLAKEDCFSEFDHWFFQSKSKYCKFGLERKINITKKIYNDPMMPKNKQKEIEDFLDFLNKYK